jgi:HSP20 family protein
MEVCEMDRTFPLGSEFVLLSEVMNQLFNESVVPSGGSRSGWQRNTPWALPLDVYATPDEAVIIAAVPGMNPQDLEVTYNQNVVTLSGTVPTAAESEQGKSAMWYVHELWHGPFRRNITLPFEVDPSKAQAVFDNGIVRITLPKAEWAKPHKIAVTAGGSQEAITAGSAQQ